MAQRKSVRGPRSSVLWLVIILVLVLAIALAWVVFVIGPERQFAVQATATAQAHTSEVQRAYDAGVAFASAGDWDKAAEEFARVVGLEPGYKDAAVRLAEARTSATESEYQRGLGYFNVGRWEQAKAEFEQVIAVDPNYKDVQAKWAEAEVRLAETRALTPAITPAPPETPMPTPSMTPQPTPAPELLISNLAVASGRDYQVEYDALQVGSLQYTDRDYTFTLLPQGYDGLTYIRTACDDKGSQGTRFLVFEVNRDVRIYVAFDSRIERPTWLATWEPTGDNLYSSSGGLALNIFQKDFAAGWVELGGAYAPRLAMYTVLIQPK